MKEKIIIVDDESCMLNILNFYLKKDFEVIIKTNPLDVIDYCKEDKEVKYILTDFYMPEMTGLELSKIIKNNVNPEIKIFLMSGSHLESSEISFFDGFLKKPFTKNEIINKIKGE